MTQETIWLSMTTRVKLLLVMPDQGWHCITEENNFVMIFSSELITILECLGVRDRKFKL